MKPLIIANWKMNPLTLAEVNALFDSVQEGLHSVDCRVVICPPFVYLADLARMENSNIIFGAQNCHFEEKGAYTGEISALMLKDLGCQYVLAGHSERRKYFGETNEAVGLKVKAIRSAGLKPILCVGENDEQRKNGQYLASVQNQIAEYSASNEELIVAYEPVWAIGTGNACGIDEAKEMADYIRGSVKNCVLLYGGSVSSSNGSDYIKNAGYDGLLVGGASLDSAEFLKIVKSVA